MLYGYEALIPYFPQFLGVQDVFTLVQETSKEIAVLQGCNFALISPSNYKKNLFNGKI